MTFNDFKAYRAIWRPVWELKKWRAKRPVSKFWSNVRFTIFIVGSVLMGSFRVCHAADKCEDPGLKPELKAACYQMEKVCAEVGCAVSVR